MPDPTNFMDSGPGLDLDAAVRLVARRVLLDRIRWADSDAAWQEFREIGEHDWAQVWDQVQASAMDAFDGPDDEFKLGYDYLKVRGIGATDG